MEPKRKRKLKKIRDEKCLTEHISNCNKLWLEKGVYLHFVFIFN